MRRGNAVFALILVAAAVVGFIVIQGADTFDGHHMTVTIPEATSVNKGEAIRLSGVKIGEVTGLDPVNGGRDARLRMVFADKVWPLPVGSKLQLRWSGTVNANNRYIALKLVKGGADYADAAAFHPQDFSVPVEFDQFLGTFNAGVRSDIKDFLRQGGASMSRARRALSRALQHAPPATEEASQVLSDVAQQQSSLQTLITSGDRVLGAVQASDPGIKQLLDGTDRTFDAIGDRATNLQSALSEAPATFTNVRDTLHRADSTLTGVRALAGNLSGGVTEVRRSSAPLSNVLTTLRRVGPDATATLASVRLAAPDLTQLLARVETLSPQLGGIGRQSVEALKCIRPYSPEIFSFFSTWGDYAAIGDGKDKLFRAQVQNYGPAFSNLATYTPGEAAQLFPGLEYGFPRPPGILADQPWFLPKCGAGPDAIDPSKDTEAGGYDGTAPPPVVP